MHCGEVYDSYLIQWLIEPDIEGKPMGMWRCPIEECDGAGFGFDIFPVDSDFADERGPCGWSDDDEDEDGFDECDCGEEGCDICDDADWLQVDGEDCIFSVEDEIESIDDEDWLESSEEGDDEADRPASPAKQQKRRGRQRRNDNEEDIPF